MCPVAGIRRGVIFTEPVCGPSLVDLLLLRPGDTRELLAAPFAELAPLHRPGAARRLGPSGIIAERSIPGTFLRKFNGLSGATYVDQLGADRCEPDAREELVELVRRSVDRLRRLRLSLPSADVPTLAYGDLKPEHVIFPDGTGARPVLLDPGLLRASPMADLAKLVSRTVLSLAAHRPGHTTTARIVDGMAAFAEQRAQMFAGRERRLWLWDLLALWLMDTVNILSTYLSAPSGLPLPRLGAALVERALPVCRLVDVVSADLTDRSAWRRSWHQALACAEQVAA
ncbi:hypothetical protein [Streptomyces broussonetiae]|uniref:Phosphotransferase n=1 Tax=Streptomyces broussonetiae TaxID=2686304 RepID=A0ABV5EK16_9ACTN